MPHKITHTETRWARHIIAGSRNGITVADLRAFLAEVEAVGIPDDARVRIDTRLLEGGATSGTIDAETKVSRDPAEATA